MCLKDWKQICQMRRDEVLAQRWNIVQSPTFELPGRTAKATVQRKDNDGPKLFRLHSVATTVC